MKRLLYIFLFSLLFLSGCEKKAADIAPAALFEMNGDMTAAGIVPGDGKEDFIRAYQDYTIQVAYDDPESQYLVMSIRKIPYQDSISTMIANFFINGKPVSEETLCRDNDVPPSGLHTLLSSPDYLRKHEVVYRYLRFSWEDGAIDEIESEELNYNETFETPCIETRQGVFTFSLFHFQPRIGSVGFSRIQPRISRKAPQIPASFPSCARRSSVFSHGKNA